MISRDEKRLYKYLNEFAKCAQKHLPQNRAGEIVIEKLNEAGFWISQAYVADKVKGKEDGKAKAE